MQLLEDLGGDADASRLGDLLQTYGHVHAIAVEVAVRAADDVTQIDADPEGDLPFAELRDGPLASRRCTSNAQITASTGLPNSTIAPSPVVLIKRPCAF